VNDIKEALEDEMTVESVYIFGSRARGDHREDSDYDIAIVSPDFEDQSFSKRQQTIRPLLREVLGTVSLDVVCYTCEEFEEGKDAFLPRIIAEEGVSA